MNRRNRIALSVASLLLAGLSLDAGVLTGPEASAAPALRSATVEHGQHVWWNVGYATLLDVEGAYTVTNEAGVVWLRPEHDCCQVTIVADLSGDVVDYPLTTGGEIVLLDGWIAINQRDQETLHLGEDGGGMMTGCDYPADCDALIPWDDLESLKYDGDCWVAAETPPAGCKYEKSCSGTGQEGCTLTARLTNGLELTYSAACGGNLTIKQCRESSPGSETMICICNS